jgi:hypothetical protein
MYNVKSFTFRPLSIGSTHEIEPYVHITYIGNNETDTRQSFTETDIPAQKIRFSFFPQFTQELQETKEQCESK